MFIFLLSRFDLTIQPSPNETPRSSLDEDRAIDRERERPQSPDQSYLNTSSAPLLPTTSSDPPSYPPPSRTNGIAQTSTAKPQPRMWDGALDGPADTKTSKDLTNIKLAKNQLVCPLLSLHLPHHVRHAVHYDYDHSLIYHREIPHLTTTSSFPFRMFIILYTQSVFVYLNPKPAPPISKDLRR